MLSSLVIALVSVVTVVNSDNSSANARQLTHGAESACNVTIPNGVIAGLSPPQAGSYAMPCCQLERLDCGQTKRSYSKNTGLALQRETAHLG